MDFLKLKGKISLNLDLLITSVFYSSLVVYLRILNWDFAVKDFSGRMLGQATAENFDISSRVSLYYSSCIIFFTLCILIGFLLFYFLKFINSRHKAFLNSTSAAGLMLFFTCILNDNSSFFTLSIVLIVQALYYFNLLLIKLLKNTTDELNMNFSHYLCWLVISSFSLFFLFSEFRLAVGWHFSISTTIFILTASFVLSLITIIFHSTYDLRKLFIATLPLALIPFLSVFSDELYLILNQHYINFLSPNKIYFAGVLLIVISQFVLHWKSNGLYNKYENVFKYLYIPVFIGGLAFFVYYTPFFSGTLDLCEASNPVLAVQGFYEFGRIPFLDSFNCHLLSEIVFPFTYTLLNGYSNESFLAYNFIPLALSIVTYYYIILLFTSNVYFSIFISLLFVFTPVLFPAKFFVFFICIFILFYALKKRTTIAYYLFFISTFLILMWQIDTGIASFISLYLTFVFYMILGKNWVENRSQVLKALLFALITAALVLIPIALYLKSNFFVVIKDVLNFFNSVQSYGLKPLTYVKGDSFYIQYFILPVIIASALVVTLFKVYIKQLKADFSFYIVFLLTLFYLTNYNRGIVRHSHAEGLFSFILSFGIFLIGAYALLLMNLRNVLEKFVVFIAITSIFTIATKIPDGSYAKLPFLDDVEAKLKDFPNLKPAKEKINRLKKDEELALANYSVLVNFLKENLKADENFIDFSNSPMLYFYIHKVSPNYFNQSLISNHNDYLQGRYLEGIKKFKMPFVVFSKAPLSWWDITDGIPNTVRHYKIAGYIYDNYKPYLVINNYCIWKKTNYNNFSLDSFVVKNNFQPDTFSIRRQEYDLRSIPYIWGKYDENTKSDKLKLVQTLYSTLIDSLSEFKCSYNFVPFSREAKPNYLLINASNLTENPVSALVSYGDSIKKGAYKFLILGKEKNNYLVRLSMQYNWLNNLNNRLLIDIDTTKVKINQIVFSLGQ